MTGYISKKMLGAARLPDTPSARAYLDKILEDDDTQVYGDALTIAYQNGYFDGKKAAQPAQEPVEDATMQSLKDLWRSVCDEVGKAAFAQPEQEPIREAFEKWVKALPNYMDTTRFEAGYSDCNTDSAWAAWQAAQPAQRKPTQELEALFTNIDHAISSGAWNVQKGSQTWEIIDEAKAAHGIKE
jgi:hypothetical protein